MACLTQFGDPMLHCCPSIVKPWSNRSTFPARIHPSGSGSFVSPVRPPDYFIGRFAAVSKKIAPFSSYSSSSYAEATSDDVVLVDEEEALGPLPLQFAPCLMLPPGSALSTHGGDGQKLNLLTLEEDDNKKENEREFYRFFSIREKRVMKMKIISMPPWQREILPPDEAICIGSSHGWLAFIHPRNCSLYLFSPFAASRLPYLPLPPIETLPSVISSTRRRRNSQTPSSSPSIVTEFTVWGQFSAVSSQELSLMPFFKKMAMSSPPLPFSSNHNDDDSDKSCSECTVVAIQGYSSHNYSLAFCRIGGTGWTALDFDGHVSYHDVIYFSKDQLFYALSTSWDLVEAFDLRDPASPKNTTVISHLPPIKQKLRPNVVYLVESSGELLMVVRYSAYSYSIPQKTLLFEVYKLDLEKKEWIFMPSLGDNRALLVGLNESISVSASNFPDLPMNCIYFSSPCAEILEDSHDMGVFNLEDKSFTPIYNYDSKIHLPSFWIVPPHK